MSPSTGDPSSQRAPLFSYSQTSERKPPVVSPLPHHPPTHGALQSDSVLTTQLKALPKVSNGLWLPHPVGFSQPFSLLLSVKHVTKVTAAFDCFLPVSKTLDALDFPSMFRSASWAAFLFPFLLPLKCCHFWQPPLLVIGQPAKPRAPDWIPAPNSRTSNKPCVSPALTSSLWNDGLNPQCFKVVFK